MDCHKGKRLLAMKRTLRLGTWNIQGISTKRDLFKEIERYDMDMVAFTETKKKGKGTEEKDGYVHIYSGVPKEERARGGVSVAIKKKYKKCIKSWDQINHRLLQVDIDVRNHSLIIIAAYAPTDDALTAEKDSFFSDLMTTLEKVGNRKEVFLIGDLNGKTGTKLNDSVVGRYGEAHVNNNGERLIHLCEQNELRIANGWFSHRDIHKYTWTQPTRNLKSIIDYIIVKQKTELKISDVRVMRGPECGSDHFLVTAKTYFPYKKDLHHNKQPDKEGTPLNNIKYNIESLRNNSTKFLYQMRLAMKLNRVREGTTDEIYENLKTCIHEAASEALGEKVTTGRYRKDTPWWSEYIETLVDEKKAAYEKWLATQNTQDRLNYCDKRRKAQKEIIKAKNDYWEETCQDINLESGNTKVNKAWKIIKGLRTQHKDTTGMSLISLEEWKSYYENLLTENRAEFMQDYGSNYISQTQTEKQTIIDSTDVRKALQQMKNKKSPGLGYIPVELLKAAPSAAIEILADVFDRCLNGEEPPNEWKKAIISSIFKKGNRRDCTNYRGISVICTVARLYGKVIKHIVETKITESEEQNGFRAGRSCTDGIFTLKHLIEKRLERGRAVHLTFVDLQKAYDTVPLSKLWVALQNSGISNMYVQAIRRLYEGCSSTVKVGNTISKEFSVNKGLRQGCSLAPTLFKIYLEEVLKHWKRKCKGMGIPVGHEILYTLLFADDQVLIAGDKDDSSYMLRKLFEEYSKWGLIINTKKTEYMVVGEDEREDLDIGICKIKNVCTFKYLGVTLTTNGKSTQDVTNKIGQGKRVIGQLNSLLWSDKVTKKTKIMIYKSIVESITTYGAETWELTKKEKNKLMSLEMDFWRRSCRISRLDHVRNDRIREIIGEKETILDAIDSKTLTWYGHLQRMNNNRWPKKIYEWTPGERRKRGRPPRRWQQEVNEAMTSRGLQEEDWRDRKLWKLRSGRRRPS